MLIRSLNHPGFSRRLQTVHCVNCIAVNNSRAMRGLTTIDGRRGYSRNAWFRPHAAHFR